MIMIEGLRRAEVFLGLDDNALKMIASLPSTREEHYETGQFLFKAGSDAKNMYIVKEGQVNIIVEVPEKPGDKSNQRTVDVISQGSLMGWSAIVRPHLYALSGVCQQSCKVISINGDELLSLFDQNYLIGYKVLLGLSQVIGLRYRILQQALITGKRWPFIANLSGT
jgi:CRP-like cAMP-binding protein